MLSVRSVQRLLASLLMIWLASAVAYAQNLPDPDELKQQTRQVSDITRQFANDGADVEGLKQRILRQRSSLTELQANYRDERDRLIGVLNRLGPSVEGEAGTITQQRDALNAQAQTVRDALGQIEQNLSQIARLEHEFEAARRSAFYSELTDRVRMMINPSSWVRAGDGIANNYASTRKDVQTWLADEDSGELNLQSGLLLLVAFFAAFICALPLRHWLTRRLIDPLARVARETDLDVFIGLARAFLRTIPSILAILMVAHTLTFLDLASPSLAIVLQSLWVALGCLAIVSSLCSVFFSTANSLPPFYLKDRGRALMIWTLSMAAAGLLGLDQVLRTQLNVFGGVSDVDTMLRGSTAIALALVILALLRVWKRPQSDSETNDDEPRPGVPGWLHGLIGFIVLLAIPAALFGYSALAHFVTTRIVLLAGLFLTALIFRKALKEIFVALFAAANRRRGRHRADDDEMMDFWFAFLSSIVIGAASLPLTFLLIGFSWDSVQSMIMQAVTGVSIGKIRISLLQIAIAILVFIAMIFVTKLIQRTTQTRVLNRLKVDPGVQNSLKTLIGYVGLVIAFFTGVSLLGFDLSNLAIIAGALSVGIGFGLQSIVNNFVSGLILLFERPIKVGDWVVTTSGEGIVKNISVRSTEIETFDRSSILVPNSELISNSVTNWTHKNSLGRVTVLVGVAYKEDPETILELLSRIPDQIDLALDTPQPQFLFTGFGDSSLDFELRFFIQDVTKSIVARTQARIAVFKVFKEAGVEIPFPQRDLHVRTMPEEFFKSKSTE